MKYDGTGPVILLSVLLMMTVAVFAQGLADDPEETSGGDWVPIHPDSAGLMNDFLDATRAAILEDHDKLILALDRIEAGCDKIYEKKDDRKYSWEMKQFAQAFHMTLEEAREHARSSTGMKIFEQYQWVERGCRICHDQARKEGYLPDEGPLPLPEETVRK